MGSDISEEFRRIIDTQMMIRIVLGIFYVCLVTWACHKYILCLLGSIQVVLEQLGGFGDFRRRFRRSPNESQSILLPKTRNTLSEDF